MGGHNAGEVASAMAVRVLEEEMRTPTQPTEEALRRAVERANEEIWRASKEREGCAGMGTTITALCMEGNMRPTSPRWATAAPTSSATAPFCR